MIELLQSLLHESSTEPAEDQAWDVEGRALNLTTHTSRACRDSGALKTLATKRSLHITHCNGQWRL